MKFSDNESLNMWGKVFLFVGVGVVIGFAYYINAPYLMNANINWDLINSLLLWLIFVLLVIMVNKEHIEEIKCLRQIAQEQLKEMQLLRKDLKGRKK
ncbi:hypothetical protein KY320_03565 [Candidatus Woesearchaeota archaeon]|nr:hypothetical protein [Candidatus Woesearchaeota archaeon]